MRVYEDLVGQTFGRLTVLSFAGSNKSQKRMWLCECVCGKSNTVSTGNLKSGEVTSCGCYQKDQITKSCYKHGQSNYGKEKQSIEYRTWVHIKGRCHTETDESYPDYGARGISVCPRWRYSFENFFADMGVRPKGRYSIERRDNDGDYSPENCYWGTDGEQSRNKRNNRWYTYEGERMVLQDWANRLGVGFTNLNYHLKNKTFEEMMEFYKNKNSKK